MARGKDFAAKPEELVRQLWLHRLHKNFGYPQSRLAVQFLSLLDATRQSAQTSSCSMPIIRSSDLRGRYGTVSEVTVVRQKRFNPHYITAFVRSVAGQMQIERFITGATGQLHLYGRDVSKFWVPVVPSGVQLEFEHGYCRQARAPGVPRIVGSRETSRRNRHRGLRDGSFGLAVRCDGGTMTRAC